MSLGHFGAAQEAIRAPNLEILRAVEDVRVRVRLKRLEGVVAECENGDCERGERAGGC
jgi:hypothetical protein